MLHRRACRHLTSPSIALPSLRSRFPIRHRTHNNMIILFMLIASRTPILFVFSFVSSLSYPLFVHSLFSRDIWVWIQWQQHQGQNTISSSHDSIKATHFLSSSTVFKSEFHHTLVVSNIKNHIHIILEMEKDQYGTWVELFHIHVSKDKTSSANTSNVKYEQWTTLDSSILQWIYSIISTNTVTIILKPNSTAMTTWNHFAGFFKTIRMLLLSPWSKNSIKLVWRIFPMSLLTIRVLRWFMPSWGILTLLSTITIVKLSLELSAPPPSWSYPPWHRPFARTRF